MTKYLLCRPKAGWNDLLCQINRCLDYAQKYNLTLIVDTKYVAGIKDDFSNYFDLLENNSQILLNYTEVNHSILKDLDFFASEDLNQYQVKIPFWNGNYSNFSFDYNIEYVESLLIHQTDGGGEASFNLLRKLKLKKQISDEIKNEISYLGSAFYAIMIRNTDYTTNYKVYYEKMKSEINRNCILVVASDDRSCIDYAYNFFDCEVISFSNPPCINTGKPTIYGNHGSKLQNYRNKIALKDLFICASAFTFYPTFISKYKEIPWGDNKMGGFIALANHLHQNRQLLQIILQN